jgi:hypothetical protein
MIISEYAVKIVENDLDISEVRMREHVPGCEELRGSTDLIN